MPEKTSILCVAPFNNPHILPTYDAMSAQPDTNVIRASLRPLPAWRLRLGWPEMPADAPYLQPWKKWTDRVAYYRALMSCDIVIFPGFFHTKTLPLHHWARRLTGKPALLWSEPFLLNPKNYVKRRDPWGKFRLYALLKKPCDSPKVHLLSIGYQAAEDYYATGVKRWNCWLFGFAVEPQSRPEQDSPLVPHPEVHFVYSGALRELKRADLLIEALGQPELADRPWRLTIMGDGEERETLQAAADRRGIADKVAFLGYVARDRCDEIYSQADVLVLPSRFDGWGAVVNEAMEHGLAVICSDAVSSNILVSSGENGFVFRSGDLASLADGLKQVVEDRALLMRMRESSRRRITQYRPAAVAQRLTALCRGIVGHAPIPDYSEGFCSPIVPGNRTLEELFRVGRAASPYAAPVPG